ncbi:MAG TPA: hypothetical protein VJU15_00180 [Gemmatimonadales bacterium]|nr:hypothetical protein [Gemmatimonadales bacterium]
MSRAKQILGLLGLMTAIAGIALENRVMVWIAIGLLALSVLLRIVVQARLRREERSREQSD